MRIVAACPAVMAAGLIAGGYVTSVSVSGSQATSTSVAPPSAGLLTGQVVDPTGHPIPGAVATLTNLGRNDRQATLTNGAGYFVFQGLVSGSYSLEVLAAGYLPGAFGRHQPEGLPQVIKLADSQKQTSLRVTLWAPAAVSGTVTDETGQPVVGVRVCAWQRVARAGHWVWQMVGSIESSSTTDDRGRYRIDSLPPGDYVMGISVGRETLPDTVARAYTLAASRGALDQFVRAYPGTNWERSASGDTRVETFVVRSLASQPTLSPLAAPASRTLLTVYPTTFAPSALDLATARVLRLASGVEVNNVDLSWQPVAAGTIRGQVTGPDGPASNVGLQLLPAYALQMAQESDVEAATTISTAQGAFTFVGVPPGAYMLRALQLTPVTDAGRDASPGGSGRGVSGGRAGAGLNMGLRSGPAFFANVPIVVTGQTTSTIEVTLSPGFHVSGSMM